MSSKFIVTGGCGFVGHPLTIALLELGHQVRVIDAMWFGNYLPDHENLEIIESDIRNLEESCFEGVDTVFHLANVANDPCSDLNSKLNWEVNALASMQLVEMAIKRKSDSSSSQALEASTESRKNPWLPRSFRSFQSPTTTKQR